MTTGYALAATQRLLRDLAPQVLGAVARRHDDFAAAEDAVQEALIAAANQWPMSGLPDNPRGWLYQVAIRRLTDHIRSETSRKQREQAIARETGEEAPEFAAEDDDSLLLLFMSCHPALTAPTAVALTLRAVGGLTTGEIAKAFFVPEATMTQRITRAKATIKGSGIPFAMPSPGEMEERLASVRHVLYLVFNEGYASSSGSSLQRLDLAEEAIRLTRMLRAQLPDDAEVLGLLALMLLTHARRHARTGPAGELVPLDEQDRDRWDRALIEEGRALVELALPKGRVGAYQLQAAIAALHDEAVSTEATDWAQVRALYEVLLRVEDNPMVRLNHAIAVAMVEGPAAGLALLDTLDREGSLKGHYRLDAVRAHLFERAGDDAKAATLFRAAADRTASTPERNYLLTKAAKLSR